MKRCSGCKQTLDDCCFSKSSTNGDGLQSYCRKCASFNNKLYKKNSIRSIPKFYCAECDELMAHKLKFIKDADKPQWLKYACEERMVFFYNNEILLGRMINYNTLCPCKFPTTILEVFKGEVIIHKGKDLIIDDEQNKLTQIPRKLTPPASIS